jgi:ABC-2 type transport system ATP-binding protein
MLTGVLAPSRGTARVAGFDILSQAEALKAHIGYMPQGLGLNLYDALTVEENIDFFGDLREVPDDLFQRHKNELLQITQLDPFRDRLASQLSGGMRQKLALCCTLIHLPELIFLDEPTTGVDPISRRDFWIIINRLVVEQGTTVLLTTSYLDEAERCHQIALLYEGRIMSRGATLELQVQAGIDAQGRPRTLEEVFIQAMTPEKEKSQVSPVSPPGPLTTPRVRSATPAIRVVGLTKKFGKFVAVQEVSFEVKTGEIYGFLGPNGAGKTTVIKMLTGILTPTSGRAYLAELDLLTAQAQIKSQLGYMSQKFSLYQDLSVAENIRLYGGVYGMSEGSLKDRIPEILAMADLQGQEDRLAGALPLGIRQRLALGCAILHQPRILFLDEPTAGVDPLARRKFWQIIGRLASGGVTILVSTHYMDEAQHCDRLAFIHQGQLVGVGAPEELRLQAERAMGRLLDLGSPAFREVFLLLRQHYPRATLHGSRVRLSTLHPEMDRKQVEDILLNSHLPFDPIGEVPLSMEDTFIYFMQVSSHVEPSPS